MQVPKITIALMVLTIPCVSFASAVKVLVDQEGIIIACQANMDKIAYRYLKNPKLFPLTGEKYIFYDQFFIEPDPKNNKEKICCLTAGEPFFGSYPVRSCEALNSNKMPLLQQEFAKLAPTVSKRPDIIQDFFEGLKRVMEGKLAKSWYSEETIKGIKYTRYTFSDVERNKAYRTLYNVAASIVEESLNKATNQSESTYSVMRLGSWYHWYYSMRTKFDRLLNSMRFHKS